MLGGGPGETETLLDLECISHAWHFVPIPPVLPEFLEGKPTACFVHHCIYTQHAEQCPGPSLGKSAMRTGSGMKPALYG